MSRLMPNKKQMLELMGKLVEVHHVLHKTVAHSTGKTIWKRVERNIPLVGWVTGFSYRMEGKTEWLGEGEGNAFVEDRRVPCVLITPWPTMKQIPVPVDAKVAFTEELPNSPQRQSWLDTPEEIKKTVREACREDALTAPRNPDGSFK